MLRRRSTTATVAAVATVPANIATAAAYYQ